MTGGLDENNDRIGPWLATFPERRQSGGEAAVRALLDELDEVPDSLTPWRSDPAAPWRLRGQASSRAALPARVARIPFASWYDQQVSDLVAEAVEALHSKTAMVRSDPWAESLRSAAIEVVATCQMRSVLLLLAERRHAGLNIGASPSERYQSFELWLASDRGQQAFHERFGDVLNRSRAMVAMQLEATVHDLTVTAENWPGIRETIGIKGDRIRSIDVAGDSHCGGHRVMIGTADSGDRLVIKPRGVLMESAYAQWTQFLGDLVGLDMPLVRSMQSATVGWTEFIGARNTEPTAADWHHHEDFFAMIGVHLAALYLINGTDVHFENVLTDVVGRPVVIDAEALFAPPVETTAQATLRGVQSVGMLSVPMGSSGVDLGALEYRPGGDSPLRSWAVVNAGRDDISLEMQTRRVDKAAAIPDSARLDHGAAVAILAAFSTLLAWVTSNRDDVLSKIDELFTPTASARYIHRPTMAYALVQRMATHPQFARDRDWGRALGRVVVLQPESPRSITDAEVAQLRRGEIPYFAMRLDDVVLGDGLGNAIGLSSPRSPRDEVRQAIENLTEDLVAQQLAVLEDALGHWITRR